MSKYTNALYPDKINDLVDNDGNVHIPGGGGETPFEWITTVIEPVGEMGAKLAIDMDTFQAIADEQPIKIDMTISDGKDEWYYPLVYKELIQMGVCYNTHEDGSVVLVKLAMNPSTGLPEAILEIQAGVQDVLPYEWTTTEDSSSEQGDISYLHINGSTFEEILIDMPLKINLTIDYEDSTLNSLLTYEKALPTGVRYSGICMERGIVALDLVWDDNEDVPMAIMHWTIGDEPQPGGNVNDWEGIGNLLNEIAQNIDEGHYVPIEATFEIKNSRTWNLTETIECIETYALAHLFGLTVEGNHYTQGCAFNVNLTESYSDDEKYFTHPLSWYVTIEADAETGDSRIVIYLDESYIEQTGNNGWQIHANGIDSHNYDMHSWKGRVSGTITIKSLDIWE